MGNRLGRAPRQAVVLVLLGYHRLLSPLFPPACRFVPSCSKYAAEAVAQQGIVRGTLLATRRVLRCHPYSAGGYDPVPARGPRRE